MLNKGDKVRVIKCDSMPEIVGQEGRIVLTFSDDTYKIAVGFSDVGRWFCEEELELIPTKRPVGRPKGYSPKKKKG